MGDAREELDGQLHNGMEDSKFSTHRPGCTIAGPTAERFPCIVL